MISQQKVGGSDDKRYDNNLGGQTHEQTSKWTNRWTNERANKQASK